MVFDWESSVAAAKVLSTKGPRVSSTASLEARLSYASQVLLRTHIRARAFGSYNNHPYIVVPLSNHPFLMATLCGMFLLRFSYTIVTMLSLLLGEAKDVYRVGNSASESVAAQTALVFRCSRPYNREYYSRISPHKAATVYPAQFSSSVHPSPPRCSFAFRKLPSCSARGSEADGVAQSHAVRSVSPSGHHRTRCRPVLIADLWCSSHFLALGCFQRTVLA